MRLTFLRLIVSSEAIFLEVPKFIETTIHGIALPKIRVDLLIWAKACQKIRGAEILELQSIVHYTLLVCDHVVSDHWY